MGRRVRENFWSKMRVLFLFVVCVALGLACSCKSQPADDRLVERYRMKDVYTMLVEYAYAHDGELPQKLTDLRSAEGFREEYLRSGPTGKGDQWIYSNLRRLRPESSEVLLVSPFVHKQGVVLELRSDGKLTYRKK